MDLYSFQNIFYNGGGVPRWRPGGFNTAPPISHPYKSLGRTFHTNAHTLHTQIAGEEHLQLNPGWTETDHIKTLYYYNEAIDLQMQLQVLEAFPFQVLHSKSFSIPNLAFNAHSNTLTVLQYIQESTLLLLKNWHINYNLWQSFIQEN